MANKKEAFLSKVRSTEIAVELLDMNERTIGRVEGTLINGGISVDGDSAVRRVANLTFLTTDDNYKVLETSNELSLNKKIKIFIGVKDLTTMNSEISWYNQGIYIMTNSTSSASIDSQQISITAQDKMCLHNGEVAGELQYTTRIDSEVVSPEFQTELDAIQLLYSTLAGDFANRIAHLDNINARVITVYNQVVGDNSIIEAQCTSLISKIAILKITTEDKEYKKLLKDLKDDISNLKIESQNKKLTIREIIKYAVVSLGGETPGRIIINDVPDKVRTPIKLPSGENGFKMVKYIYPQDLTLSTGQPLTVIYDRCKEALGGNYEYFYDVEGNFVFQEVKNYRNTQAVPLEDLKSEDYALSYDRTPVQFDFTEDSLITSYNNAPNWGNIKNDFYVWGNDGEKTVGYHLAIDDKPSIPYGVIDQTALAGKLDWREYILHVNNVGRNRNFIGKWSEENLENPAKEKPKDNLMSTGDFSDFTPHQGATVTRNKTFPVDMFKGNKNLALDSDGGKRFDETHLTSTTYYDEVEHLNYELGTNLLLKSSEAVQGVPARWSNLQDKTWR